MRFKITALNAFNNGTGIVLNVGIPIIYAKQIDRLISEFMGASEYELKPYKQKRSLSANAYLWVLCDKIAEKIRITPEDIYKDAISHVGVFEEIKVTSKEAGNRFKKIWRSNGTGWLTKSLDDTTILAYYGSSTYNTQQMARVIDYLIDVCNDIGVEVRPQAEVDAMLNEWKKRK